MMHCILCLVVLAASITLPARAVADTNLIHDAVVKGGLIYDGNGGPPFSGEVAIDGDRITYVGPATGLRGRKEIDAAGKAVAPGFKNILAQGRESLLFDYRGLSDLSQGVTLGVIGE
jgi:N-acyl-D-amino-acid deacylase